MVLTNNKQLTYNKHIFLGFNHFNLFNVSKLCTLVFPCSTSRQKKEVYSCFPKNTHKMKETIWRENVANVETVKI